MSPDTVKAQQRGHRRASRAMVGSCIVAGWREMMGDFWLLDVVKYSGNLNPEWLLPETLDKAAIPGLFPSPAQG